MTHGWTLGDYFAVAILVLFGLVMIWLKDKYITNRP